MLECLTFLIIHSQISVAANHDALLVPLSLSIETKLLGDVTNAC
jgi:hypothetical protein